VAVARPRAAALAALRTSRARALPAGPLGYRRAEGASERRGATCRAWVLPAGTSRSAELLALLAA
jgi:hypothetical protein